LLWASACRGADGWRETGALALTNALTPPLARAQATWPSRPIQLIQLIQLIVPWPVGGQTDQTIRILAEKASALLGQSVVVINRPGAAGTLVAPALKAAEPDGHTIGKVSITAYRHAVMNLMLGTRCPTLRPSCRSRALASAC